MSRGETQYQAYLGDRHQTGLARRLISVARADARTVTVAGRSYINLASNDYLGLSTHPALVERAREWTERLGAGSAASRLVTGNLEGFAQIEDKIANLKGKPAALVMASGFQANAAVLEALFDRKVLGAEPLVFADKLNHASMHFGCAAAGVRQNRYRHLDADHLAEQLAKHAGDDRPKFILTESVFSMDGDVAPMAAIVALAKTHDCLVVCDDAHATGVLGIQGCGLSDGADIIIGTFSKAMGSFGAYVACSATIKDYLVNRSSGLIYSTGLPPTVLGAMDAALDLLPDLDEERRRVSRFAEDFRSEAKALGFDTGRSSTQIVPIVVGGAEDALTLSSALRAAGLWVTAIRPPTVPMGTARLRVAFSAAHREDDIKQLIGALRAANLAEPNVAPEPVGA